MIKKLLAVDESGNPVPGAIFTFSYVEDNTTWTVAAYEGGQSGSVSLDTSMHPGLFDAPNHITVTAPGFYKAGTDADVIPDSWQFIMPAEPSMVPALTLGALLAVASVVAYNNVGKKKKKVGKVDIKQDVLPYAIPGALIIGGIWLVSKISSAVGLTPSEEDNNRDAALQADIAAAGYPTMSATEIAATANALKEDLGYSWISNDQTEARRQLFKPVNTADILRIIQAYGRHVIHTFGIPRGSFTLEETVQSQMSTSNIAAVNKYYNDSGINFNF